MGEVQVHVTLTSLQYLGTGRVYSVKIVSRMIFVIQKDGLQRIRRGLANRINNRTSCHEGPFTYSLVTIGSEIHNTNLGLISLG